MWNLTDMQAPRFCVLLLPATWASPGKTGRHILDISHVLFLPVMCPQAHCQCCLHCSMAASITAEQLTRSNLHLHHLPASASKWATTEPCQTIWVCHHIPNHSFWVLAMCNTLFSHSQFLLSHFKFSRQTWNRIWCKTWNSKCEKWKVKTTNVKSKSFKRENPGCHFEQREMKTQNVKSENWKHEKWKHQVWKIVSLFTINILVFTFFWREHEELLARTGMLVFLPRSSWLPWTLLAKLRCNAPRLLQQKTWSVLLADLQTWQADLLFAASAVLFVVATKNWRSVCTMVCTQTNHKSVKQPVEEAQIMQFIGKRMLQLHWGAHLKDLLQNLAHLALQKGCSLLAQLLGTLQPRV